MSTFQGLPIHVLLVHCIVVLAPMTAVLAVLCALWPAARRRLIWLVAVLSGAVGVLTPITTGAGEWLEKRVEPSQLVRSHASLGDSMIYFSVGLLIAAALLLAVDVGERKGHPLPRLVIVAISVLVVVVSVAAVVQVYRIGESGARSVWSDAVVASDGGALPAAGVPTTHTRVSSNGV